ncbi:unnamed protein product, partial [Medioppia subpectinata]
VYLTHLSVEHLEKTKGNIINISSVAGLKPSTGGYLYSMSKCALDMFTQCLALELGPKGIRVNAINPAAVRTNFLQVLGFTKEKCEELYTEMGGKYPVGRVGESIDIANAILFLASDEASFVTGIKNDSKCTYIVFLQTFTWLRDTGSKIIMSTSKNFANKVVLITGSSGGIGAQTAVEFARYGAQVVITGRNADNLSEVAKQCAAVSPKGLKPLEVLADVSKDVDCKRLIDSTISAFKRLDILVNNAGKGVMSSINDTDILDKYREIMDTNLRSVIYLTHLSVEHLEKTKGNIINISSVFGLSPSVRGSLYCMSKCALDMFTKCMALELGPKGIRVNAVNPAAVRTNFLQAVGLTKEQSEGFYSRLSGKYPIGRVGESIDIANAILFLASDEASFVTGVNFVSDGGNLNAP